MTIISMTVGQESHKRNGVALIVNKRWRRIYSHQKQDQEMTVAQIMIYLLQNSELSWENKENL